MKPLYNQLMDSKSAPRVAPKAHSTQLGTAPMNLRTAMQKYAIGGNVTPERTKLAVFGDSISSSVGYNPDGTSDTTHGKSLADYLGTNLKLSTADNTRGGATSVDSMNGVEKDPFKFDNFSKYITENNPETALLRYGAADAALLADPATSLKNIERMVQIARQNGTKPVLVGVTPFAKMGEINAGGITGKWITDERVAAADEINRGIQKLADQYGAQFIDVRKVPVPPGALLDGIHPSGEYGFALDNYISDQISPYEDAKKAGLELPPKWNDYGANDKIDWFNNNNVSSDQLLQANMSQEDINWITNNGYTGYTAQQQPQMMAAQAQPQGMTGIAALGGDQPGYQTSSPAPVDVGNGLRRTYGGNLIDSEGYPVDSNGQRLDNPYASRQSGVTLDDGTFIAGVDNGQGGVNVGTPDFFQKYADNPEILSKLKNLYSEGAMSGAIPMGQAVATPAPSLEPPRPVERDYPSPPSTPIDNYNDLRTRVLGTPYASKEDIENFNRSVFVPNPNEYGRPGGYDQPLPAQQQTDNYLNQFREISPPIEISPPREISPPTPDYSRSYAALGGADTVNNLRNQFLGMGLDENTIGSIFSQYYAPQQPVQQMARGGMAHSDIEQYLTRLGMIRK
jgi:hypothetical protein